MTTRTCRRCALVLVALGACATEEPARELVWHDRSAADWVKDLSKPDRAVRDEAVAALAAIGPEAIPGLDPAFEDPDPAARYAAMAVLATLRARGIDGRDRAVAGLGDADPSVRAEAAFALDQMGQPAFKATRPLLAVLNDSDWYVRWRAANALGIMGRFAKHTIDRLDWTSHNDMEVRVRNACTDAIAAIRADELRASQVQRGTLEAE